MQFKMLCDSNFYIFMGEMIRLKKYQLFREVEGNYHNLLNSLGNHFTVNNFLSLFK